MDATFECPICTTNQWYRLATKQYNRDGATNEYEIPRYEVLFNLWNAVPSARSITLETIACNKCGFVTFAPRPSALDLERKYAYLNSHHSAKVEFTTAHADDHTRSDALYRRFRHALRHTAGTVLDFGGGNGRLLSAFIAHGHPCSVVDFVDQVVEDVVYLGADIHKLPLHSSFSLIICSHVVEHLADPVSVLSALANVLDPKGRMYIEVPFELWRHPPPTSEPVTHLNFFTTNSLRTLLQIAGLRVISCNYEPFKWPNGKVGIAVKAVAERMPEDQKACITLSGVTPVLKMLAPSYLARALRVIRNPLLLTNSWR